jgi:hypothetical protein
MVLRLIASWVSGAGNKPAPSVPAAPRLAAETRPVAAAGWTDDSALRRLAGDYNAGRSKWVLAGDLAEFYRKLDRYDRAGLGVEVRQDVADIVAGWLGQGLHIEKPGNDVLIAIGPQEMAGLRLTSGGSPVADLDWTYNVIESWFGFSFRDQAGVEQRRRFDCGMELDDITQAMAVAAPGVLGKRHALSGPDVF